MTKDFKAAAKNSLIYSFGNIITKVIGLVLIPIYTDKEYLTISDFGLLGNIEVTSQLLIAIIGISLYQSLFRWYFENTDSDWQKSIVYTISVAIVIFAIIVYALFEVFSSSISLYFFENLSSVSLLRFVVLTACLETIAVIPLTLFRLQQKASYYFFHIQSSE